MRKKVRDRGRRLRRRRNRWIKMAKILMFDVLVDYLSLLSKKCTDLDIRAAFLRQRSDDKLSIFEADLSPAIGNIDLSFVKV